MKIMKLKLLFALLVVQLGYAQQRTCGMQEEMQRIMADPQLKQNYLDLQQQFQSELQRLQLNQEARLNGQSVNSTNALIRIPVAVHYPSVVADNSTPSNVSLRACLVLLAQQQINILNADYNAMNSDISNWTADSAFFPGVNTGNMNVSWELATLNHPTGSGQGFPANGSPAVTFGTDFLSGANSDATWSGYCNLVVRPLSGGTLGYSPLGGSPSAGMTVVIDNNAFGATMSGSPSTCTGYIPGAPYNLGRTLTHELGHFFNLDHTFAGCDPSGCTSSGDRVCDTPAANDPEYNCPAAGTRISGCGETQLTMNYMDYPPDACMYMFTAGQATRMIAWYNTVQSQIRTNVLANTDFITSNFSIAPNPNKGTFNIQFKDLTAGYAVEIFDVTGKVVYENNFNAASNLVQTVTLDNASKGVYFITLKSNGTVVTKKIILE
jgi:Pregnancy-associated plasma protein-A/Secretion system C-terminal sorting domain